MMAELKNNSNSQPCPFVWVELLGKFKNRVVNSLSPGKQPTGKLAKVKNYSFLDDKTFSRRFSLSPSMNLSNHRSKFHLRRNISNNSTGSHNGEDSEETNISTSLDTDQTSYTECSEKLGLRTESFQTAQTHVAASKSDTDIKPKSRTQNQYVPTLTSELNSWNLLKKKTSKALSEVRKIRDEITEDIYDFKEMTSRAEKMSGQLALIETRINTMENSSKFIDDVIKRAREAGDNMRLVNIPAERKIVRQYRKYTKKTSNI